MTEITATLNTPIPVEPINTVEITAVSVFFGPGAQYATASYNLKDANGTLRNSASMGLTEQELNEWGSDDLFVANLVANKLSARTTWTQ